MIKLKEIIKSGGGNAKINRFINRYVLSKKEKNEIINEIKNIKGNGSSSSVSQYDEYYEYITVDGYDLYSYVCNGRPPGFELINIKGICVYNCNNNYSQGGFKALLYGKLEDLVPEMNNTSPGFNLKTFGYKFSKYVVESYGDGMASSYFITNDIINTAINKLDIKFNGIGENARFGIMILLVKYLLMEENKTEDEVFQFIKGIDNKIEFKRITEEEYYGECYNKAKAYYDTLKPY